MTSSDPPAVSVIEHHPMPAVHLRVNRPDRRMRPLLHRVDRQQQHQRQTVSKRRRPHLPGSQQKRVGLRGRSRNRPRRIIAGASVCGHHHQSKIEMLRPRMFMWFLVVRFFRSTLLEATPQFCGQPHASQVIDVTSKSHSTALRPKSMKPNRKNCIAACKSQATIVLLRLSPNWIEHLTTDQEVGGSSPSKRAEQIPRHRRGIFWFSSSPRTTTDRHLGQV